MWQKLNVVIVAELLRAASEKNYQYETLKETSVAKEFCCGSWA